jgi:hypothetical protein
LRSGVKALRGIGVACLHGNGGPVGRESAKITRS